MRRACGTIIWQAVACALLLACTHTCNAIEHLAPGICPTIDVRNTPEQLNKLRGCRVIEGQLSIVLMERATAKSFENMSFPELREVTGHIKIYRLKGLRNLGDLFPNLSVVRGMQLFREYSIVIFDNESLESLGLRSLWKVERGAVRIEHNDKLCYTNTIDWSRITPPNAENIIRSNYDVRLCGLCPNSTSRVELRRMTAMQCPADTTGRLLCWDEKNCQRVCPSDCGDLSCTANGTCCHPECLGGCDGPSRRDCHVCRHFSFGYGEQRECIEKCPHGTYELYSRCVTEQECRSLPPPPAENSPESSSKPGPSLRYYKIYNRTCTYVCPSGFMETGNRYDATCGPCPESGCSRQCPGGSITTIASADLYRGCTKIQGTLEISMRAIGVNTMSVLESALGEIREIEGALKVIRAYPLVSLTFFKKLKKIGTNPPPESGSRYHSLHIFDNPNLELLWDWETHGPIEIQSGLVYIHFNPRLCYHHIMPLRKMVRDSSSFNERDISEDNGDQSSCFQTKLELKVSQLHQRAAVLTWNMFCLDDPRKLLGYSLNYIIAEQNVTIYGQRDACSDTWSVRDISMDEVRNQSAALKMSREPCGDLQPHFYPLVDLVPFTRYAAYVRTYTTSQNKDGAQSPIVYFTTLPGRPSPPTSLAVELRTPHSVYIKWGPPSMPNGTILSYHVEIEANLYNRQKILASNINYCTNPTALPNMIAVRNEDVSDKQEEKSTGEVKNGSCACKQELKPMRFTTRAEAERAESIDFENDLQNHVYIKSDRSKSNNTINRTRRSIDNGLNSMLVLLSDYHSPRFGQSYVNKTDQGYVESGFYELDGNRTGVRVLNLRHFSWYTVNVWACRQKHSEEKDLYYESAWCSERTSFVFRTLELFNADVVGNVQAEILPSNKTVPEMNVTWEPPKNPNGFVVGYNIHHSRIEDNGQTQDVGMQSCISADEFEANGRSYTTRVLAAGNYSVRVTPITLSGAGNVSADVYIFIPERTASSGVEWVWGVVGGCVAVAALVGGGAWYARRGLLPAHDGNKLFASVNPEYVSTVYVPDEWEVPRTSIEFIRELGQGSFGMVYEGIAKGLEKNKPETRCAVKTVNEHATDRERIEFLNEASVMKAFDTWHVVRLLGVVSRGQPTLVVMELMEQGDLKTYLRSHRPDAESSLPAKQPPNPPTLQNILQMAIEIADGMAYLSAKKFVHRDLAARNCMVAGDLTVKVGDFGMTRDIYETDYYRKGSKGLLPVRWMSPESLKDGVFSSNSDVWSYGVVLWEMATLAMQPYQGLSNEQVLRYVVEGGVMERPEHCPDRLYELMRACWAHRPVARPSFLQLVADLAQSASPAFRHRSFFHTPQGQELYSLQRTTTADEDQEMAEVSVGAVATGSGSNLFGVSGRLASWVRELSSLRSRASDDAAAEPLAPAADGVALKPVGGPNGTLRFDPAATGC